MNDTRSDTGASVTLLRCYFDALSRVATERDQLARQRDYWQGLAKGHMDASDAAASHREKLEAYIAATSGPIGRLRVDYPDHEAVQALYAAIKEARASLTPTEATED